jgi:hypothetical protein
MHASLKALLAGIIDYAGLFPPARLPLDEAVRNYLRYRAEPESWMLGRFVCPTARLEELGLVHEFTAAKPPFTISCLGRGGIQSDELLPGIRADLELISSFRQCHTDTAEVDVYETKLAAQILERENRRRSDVLAKIAGLLEQASLTAFFELPLDQNWRESAGALAETLAKLGAAQRRRPHGIKIRCGGVEPRDFPSAEQLAGIIHLCRQRGIPLKATAGLHHPFRYHDPALAVAMHGFLNVFGAAVLNYANSLTEDEIREIIMDENSRDFVFDDDRFRHSQFVVPTAQIVEARRAAMLSFGSCSFDEPRNDLERLGFPAQRV